MRPEPPFIVGVEVAGVVRDGADPATVFPIPDGVDRQFERDDEVEGGGVNVTEAQPALDLDRLREHRDEILRCAARRGARNVRVLGSMARREASRDADLLVEMEPGRTACST